MNVKISNSVVKKNKWSTLLSFSNGEDKKLHF